MDNVCLKLGIFETKIGIIQLFFTFSINKLLCEVFEEGLVQCCAIVFRLNKFNLINSMNVIMYSNLLSMVPSAALNLRQRKSDQYRIILALVVHLLTI